MTFTEALSAAFDDGDQVTRRSWNNPLVYIGVDDQRLRIHGFPDAGWHELIVHESDYYADDWVVVDG